MIITRRHHRQAFTLIELLVVIAIISILISLLVPAVQRVRESANRTQCMNNLHQIGIALHSYHDANKVFPPGYIDGNTSSPGSAAGDVGPGWGWASQILPYLEQINVWYQIDFSVPVGVGVNQQIGQLPLPIFQCPSDPDQQPCVLYNWNTYLGANPPTTVVAHGNYVGCSGWVECFQGAGGNYNPNNDGGAAEDGNTAQQAGAGSRGNGIFYRNSANRIADVVDGTSNTVFVGERCGAHSPSTWTGAVPQAMTPAWMATRPWTIPNTPPSQAPNSGNGTAYDSADYGEALVLAHCNANHTPSADSPFWDPDTYWSRHTARGANFLFGDGSVHYLTAFIDPYTYQFMSTIAGGEPLKDW